MTIHRADDFSRGLTMGVFSASPPIQTTPILSPGQTISGTLTTSDETDPFFADIGVFYKDDFELSGVSADQSVTVEMNSVDFDSFLDLVDADNNIITRPLMTMAPVPLIPGSLSRFNRIFATSSVRPALVLKKPETMKSIWL